jgi:RNA polymerase sigma factor (sigma-70 family)
MTVHDMDLVRQYAATRSELAFETLVSRHINLVYSSALRQVRNPQLAEEITQAVFIILARKAASLSSKTILPGWLYRTSRFTAANVLRTESNRRRREQEAQMQSTTQLDSDDEPRTELLSMLDEAMERLRGIERDALVLRYLQNKSLREVGAVLGLNEDAARKRVARGLEKLRVLFAKRGTMVSVAAIAGAMTATSAGATPMGLTISVTAAAMKGAAVSASTLTLIDGALKFMAWTKTKIAIGVAAAMALVGIVTISSFTFARPEPARIGAPNDAAGQPAESAFASAGTPTPIVAAPEAQASLAIRPAPSRDTVAGSIYPTAPRLSAILAEVRAATGGTIVPADRMIQNQYGNLFQQLELTPDQIAIFTRIVTDRQRRRLAVSVEHPFQLEPGTVSRDEGIAAVREHQQKLEALQQAVDQAADEQIRQLLGSDVNLEHFQIYRDQTPERLLVINKYADALDDAGVPPLTLDQQEHLVTVLYQARDSNDPKTQAAKIPEILQQASMLLSAQQVNVLEQYTNEMVAAAVTARHPFRIPGY